jgi:hypothetical protein
MNAKFGILHNVELYYSLFQGLDLLAIFLRVFFQLILFVSNSPFYASHSQKPLQSGVWFRVFLS